MSDSHIVKFESNLLEGAYCLEEFDLSDNFVEDIPRNFFENNHICKKIILKNNQIRSLRPDVFQPVKALEYLDLSGNMLKSFSKKILKQAGNLKENGGKFLIRIPIIPNPKYYQQLNN